MHLRETGQQVLVRERDSLAVAVEPASPVRSGNGVAHAEIAIKDASGRDVKVADTSRIVAIGGDVTEILYALKADAKIAAVDSTSQFPVQALKEKPNVGYMRALSAERVVR